MTVFRTRVRPRRPRTAKLLHKSTPGATDRSKARARGPDGAGSPPRPVLWLVGQPDRRSRRPAQVSERLEIRQMLRLVFQKNRLAVARALATCLADPKTVLGCVELLARLEGELP